MRRSRTRPHPGRARETRPARTPPAPIPPGHPFVWISAVIAAACVVLAVTYRLYDTDFWQHLRVGETIWRTRSVPHLQIWTWPTYGAPEVNVSWGFEALMWPFWDRGGVLGLFAWRWASTLVVFGVLGAVARRIGASGLSMFVVLVWCAIVYRQRVQIRPETLVGLLIALELLILEGRRRGGRDLGGWLVGVAWVWANVHLSYVFGLFLIGVFLAEDVWTAFVEHRDPARAAAAARRARALAIVAAGAVAISFLNPYGWRALWQPFEYFLGLRHEPLFRVISELSRIDWSLNARNGLVVLLALWPLAALWRARRAGLDRVELALCAAFTALAFQSQRFLGFYALVAAPYLARDVDALVRAVPWPRWTEPFPVRAALTALAMAAVTLPDVTRADTPLGIGLVAKTYPIAACDFVEREGVRGRSFNQLRSGGYLVWRFAGQRDRLPFFDSHLAGTAELRRLYYHALLGEAGFAALDGRMRFDWALLSRPPPPGDRLQDVLDADTSWALVFLDDAAALYVKRAGPLAPLADRHGYGTLGAGQRRLEALAAACVTDAALRARVRPELERAAATSPQSALAWSFLANLAMADGRWDDARRALEQALAIDPEVPEAHLRLSTVALATRRPAEAIAALERERRANPQVRHLDLRLGFAYEQLGDTRKALDAYRRELVHDPDNAIVLERIRALKP